MPVTLVPVEETLSPGEAVVPPAAVDTMATIVALSDPNPTEETLSISNDPSMMPFIVGTIIAWIVIRMVFRFMPWLIGLGALVVFLKFF
jgi:hypothetical protein